MKDRELLIGVTGGIAAFKTAALVSQLVQEGARVQVIMTAHAAEFVGPTTFAALTGREVALDVSDHQRFPLAPHIELAERAELMCVAPATASFLAKAACGLADDLLSTTLLAFAGPVLVAPAMSADMWAKPPVQRNVTQLRADGVVIIDPEEGWLSCRRRGPGRMAEPETIKQRVRDLLVDR